jgi:hypothetical protein
VAGAATLGRVTWLAVDDRLLPLGSSAPRPARRGGSLADPTTTAAPPDTIRATFAASRLPGLDPLPVSRLRTSWFPWPRLTVLFAAQQTANRSGWSIEIALAFPFGRAAAPRTDGARLAAELLSRDARLAREEASLAGVATWSPTEEPAAQLRVLRQERAALR